MTGPSPTWIPPGLASGAQELFRVHKDRGESGALDWKMGALSGQELPGTLPYAEAPSLASLYSSLVAWAHLEGGFQLGPESTKMQI